MATRISDARDRRRVLARAVEAAPYAGRGAGLYSEVSLSPVPQPPARSSLPISEEEGVRPRV